MDFEKVNDIKSEDLLEEFDFNAFSGFSDEKNPPEIKIAAKTDDNSSHCDIDQDQDIINVIYNPSRANILLNKINKTIQKYLKSANISLREVLIIKSSSKNRNDLTKQDDYCIDVDYDRNKNNPFKSEDESSSTHSQQLPACLGQNSRNKKKNRGQITKNKINNDQSPYKKKLAHHHHTLEKPLNTGGINNKAKNFQKIFGQAVIRFIIYNKFSKKSSMLQLYEDSGLQSQKSIISFQEWIVSMGQSYSSLQMFRKVWLGYFQSFVDRKFAEILTKFTKLFLYEECLNYFTKNEGERFKDPQVLEKYTECIAIFKRGFQEPEKFISLLK